MTPDLLKVDLHSPLKGASTDKIRLAALRSSKPAERRRYPRIEYPGRFSTSLGPWFRRCVIQGWTWDISASGLCLETEGVLQLPMNSLLTIRLQDIPHPPKLYLPKGAVQGRIVRAWASEKGRWGYALRFTSLVDPADTPPVQTVRKIGAAVIAGLLLTIMIALKIHDLKWFWYNPFYRVYSIAAAAFFSSRVIMALLYKEPEDKGYLPGVSIVISVMNEEGHIAETVDRCFQLRYPSDRLEVIVIDDGSTDRTWEVLETLPAKYPSLKLFRFEKNKGKRHGMALGAEKASGDILVYVDSDSFLEAEAVYRIVQPFAEEDVGAVAGHTMAVVEPNNLISKMESVRYLVSHQLFKTAESIFGTVTCCPGAFSAYRRESVLKVLPAWLNQTFLGVRSTFGDDRSLTNFILRTHRVLYHATAICVTYVPDKWSKFFRQQLRWKKSWVREATVAARIMRHKHPVAAISFYVGILVTMFSPIIFLRATLFAPLFLTASPVPYVLGVLVIYLFLCLVYLFHKPDSTYWYCGLLFAVLYMGILCWQTYYAIFTVNKTHWGTR